MMDQVHHARSEKVLLWQISLKYSSFFLGKILRDMRKKTNEKAEQSNRTTIEAQ